MKPDPAADLLQRDARHCWHPYTQHGLERELLPVASADGSLLKLLDGREVIDAISSWWAILHGHGEASLVRTLAEQAQTLDHVLFAGTTHAPAVALAEALVRVSPPGLSRVFYSDNGSTAVEVALKMVLQHWRRRGEKTRQIFIAFEHGYHGDTFGAMSVGDPDPFFEAFRPQLFEVCRIPCETQALAQALKQLGARAAAVICEPLLQGAGGMRMHSCEFLQGVRELCTSSGLPWIADEVLTGFGRTGTLFACDRAGVAPDLLCLAKGLSGGLFPLAATLTSEELYQSFLSQERSHAFFHGHTFTAHPVGCAVALTSLQLVLERDLPQRFEAIGQQIAQELEPLRQHPRVRNLRRLGGVVAFDLRLAADQSTGYLATRALGLRQAALERGVLLRPLGNVLYAMPPAATTPEQCQKIARVLRELVDLSL